MLCLDASVSENVVVEHLVKTNLDIFPVYVTELLLT